MRCRTLALSSILARVQPLSSSSRCSKDLKHFLRSSPGGKSEGAVQVRTGAPRLMTQDHLYMKARCSVTILDSKFRLKTPCGGRIWPLKVSCLPRSPTHSPLPILVVRTGLEAQYGYLVMKFSYVRVAKRPETPRGAREKWGGSRLSCASLLRQSSCSPRMSSTSDKKKKNVPPRRQSGGDSGECSCCPFYPGPSSV